MTWTHVSRRCIHCGKVGPRVPVLGGYAHRRCIVEADQTTEGKAKRKRKAA